MTLHPNGNISVSNSPDWRVTDEKILKYLEDHICQQNDTYTQVIGRYILENYIVYPNNSKATSEKEPLVNNNPDKPFVFIIDEINRGEISKIFGELFFSIDPGYRGKEGKVKTQYQNLITDENDPFKDGFYIPENVYIIGTMNDIDRSVESMDFAMRRRFAWAEIKATDNTGMLDELGNMKNEAIEIMNRLNKVIYDEETQDGIEGLSSAYHIGGAYFRKLLNYMDKPHDEALKALWDKHLKGLLYEYLRGTLNASENMNRLEAAFFKKSETVVNNQTEDDETD
ncbi:MAG: AAA family ATPase [Duncaniella sp.]|nr:AAA family ATPase [Duncaniella sp.]